MGPMSSGPSARPGVSTGTCLLKFHSLEASSGPRALCVVSQAPLLQGGRCDPHMGT